MNDTKRLLQEAAEWRLLGLLLECPKAGWREQVAGLAAEVADQELRLAAQLAQQEASEGAYHSIFGPGGPAPAREVSYLESMQLGYLLSELGGYYEAFGFPPESVEPPDHVSREASFVGYLRLKEAFAASNACAEQAELTREAARCFVANHLAAVGEPLAKALEGCGPTYLGLAGRALLRRTGPRPGAASNLLPVLDTPADACSFECGET